MRHIGAPIAMAISTLAGCSSGPVASPRMAVTPAESRPTVIDSAAIQAQLATGEHLVTTVCLGCHTIGPPPAKAPPFRMVAMRYRRQFGPGDSAVARIAAYVAAPSAQRSLMPAMMIDRFGLMPALSLPDSQLRAAARYVLSLDGIGGMGPRR